MENNQVWRTKTTYLHEVDGNEIIREQDKINDSDKQFTIGSIIIPKMNDGGLSSGKFYAWITYKVQVEVIKQAQPQTIEVD